MCLLFKINSSHIYWNLTYAGYCAQLWVIWRDCVFLLFRKVTQPWKWDVGRTLEGLWYMKMSSVKVYLMPSQGFLCGCWGRGRDGVRRPVKDSHRVSKMASCTCQIWMGVVEMTFMIEDYCPTLTLPIFFSFLLSCNHFTWKSLKNLLCSFLFLEPLDNMSSYSLHDSGLSFCIYCNTRL